MKGNTTLLESLLPTSTDNQEWIFNTKGHHSVRTESRVIVFLCTSSDGAVHLYKIS